MAAPSTREDFVRLLFRYLDPLRAHYTADGSRVVVGHASAQYEDEVIPMEAWVRPLWGLALLLRAGVRDCGFAVPGDYHERTLADVERVCRVRAVPEPGACDGEPFLIKPEANTNITCGKTLIPAVRYRIEPGETLLVTHIEVR